MSHTTTIADEDGHRWTLIHNGDYSGDVTIARGGDLTVELPVSVLVEFVGQIVRQRLIEALDDSTGTDLLLRKSQ